MEWYLKVIRDNYANFNGRARRQEFWMFTLFNVIASGLIYMIGSIIGIGQTLQSLYSLAVLVPSIAVGVRRLHDIGKPGTWMLLLFFLVIGWIWLIILFIQEGQIGTNQYGPNPKEFNNNSGRPNNMSGNPIS